MRGRTQDNNQADSPAAQRQAETLADLLDPHNALAYITKVTRELARHPREAPDEAAAFQDITGEIDEEPGVVALNADDGRLLATTLWLCGPGVELPTITLLDTCSQSDLVDKAFLDAARPNITWRPVKETVRLEGVGRNITDSRPRGWLSFCCNKQGPQFEVLVAVAELQNFGASLLLGRGTLEQLHCRVDMHHAADKAAIHFVRAGCTHVLDKTSDGAQPEIVISPAPRRTLVMPPGLVDEQRAATLHARVVLATSAAGPATMAEKHANTVKDLASPTVHPSMSDCLKKVEHLGHDAERVAKVLYSYRDVFHVSGKIGTLKDVPPFDIDYHGPPFAHKPIPMKPDDRDLVHKYMDMHVAAGTAHEPSLGEAPQLQTLSRVFWKKEARKLRLCTDYTTLNKGLGKTVLGIPSMETIRQQTAGHKCFIQMDGSSAYNQWALTQRAARAMAMVLPARRPGGPPRRIIPDVLYFGTEPAPGAFNHVMEHVFEGVPSTHVYVDDLLSGVSDDVDEGMARFVEIAERARRHHMMMAWSKFSMLVKEIKCLGFIVSEDGMRPDEARCRELIEWPEPASRRELWSYLGLYAYLAHTMPQSTTASLRQLQAGLNEPVFKWTADLSKAFVVTKALGTRWVLTAHLDYTQPVIIQTDSSAAAMGYLVAQVDPGTGIRRVVAMGSRRWPDAARNYASWELEGAALMLELRRRQRELTACKVILETDCSVAASLLTTAPLGSMPPKWMRYRMLLSSFADWEVWYVPQKQVVLCDELSRQSRYYRPDSSRLLKVAAQLGVSAVLLDKAAQHFLGEDNNDNVLETAIQDDRGEAGAFTDARLTELLNEQRRDAFCKQVDLELKSNASGQVPEASSNGVAYFYRNSTDLPGVLMRASADAHTLVHQVLLPLALQEEALRDAHDRSGHFGAVKTYQRLRATYYWPGSRASVDVYVKSCDGCQRSKTKARTVEPGHHRHRQTSDLFETISLDVLELSIPSEGYRHLLVCVDEFTGFMILVPLVTQSAAEVVSKLMERVVGTFGAPDAFLSDNGSAFTADLAKRVFESIGTQQTLTFSHWARGNAQNERSHQSIMSAIRITCEAWKGDWIRVLPNIALSYNTSAKEGTSITPYDLVFGRLPRPLQSVILPPRRPDLEGRSAVEIGLDIKEVTRSLRDAWRALRRDNYKRKEAERLPAAASFEPGDQVLIVYERGAERTSKHFYRAHGPATVLRREQDDYIVKINSTGNERKVPWLVLHRYYARTANRDAPGGVGPGVPELQSNVAAQPQQTSSSSAATAEQQRGGPSSSSSSSSSVGRHDKQQGQRPGQQQGRQSQLSAGRGPSTRTEQRDKVRPMAKMRSPAARPFAADSDDDSSSEDEQAKGTWRALVQPTRDTPPAASPSARAGPAKPKDRLEFQADDFVLVDGAQGGCSVAKVKEVVDDSEHVLVRWYGPERARAAIPELARWYPMWLTTSGSSVAAAHSKRGYQPDEHEVDRARIVYTFPDLDDDQTLPQPALRFLQPGGAKQS